MQRIHFESSDALCGWVSEQSADTCLLSFSGGKDSLAAWLQLRRFFSRVLPVYLYRIPGLKFMDEDLAAYEEYFGQRILKLPHPALYRWLNAFTFQAPERLAIIEEAGLTEFDYDDVFDVAKAAFGLAPDTWTAIGVRAADSFNRRASITRYGAVDTQRRTFYPTYDWNKDYLLDQIKQAGITLSVDYQLFGRSFDGIDYRFLKPLRDAFPEDYAKVIEWFPMAELEIKRIEYRERYYAEHRA